jgi:hypothetical protein
MKERYVWNTERLETLGKLLRDGKTYPQIAKALGSTEDACKVAASRYKVRPVADGRGSPSKLEILHEGISETDLAKRIQVLLGVERRTEPRRAAFTDEQLRTFIGNETACQTFSKDVLNSDLQSHQLEMVANMLTHRRCVFILGRQAGKDWALAAFAIWRCITTPNERLLIISPAQRQSDLLYNRILSWVGGSNELFDSVEKSTAEFLRFSNGSEIWSLPSTSYIRGFTEVTYAILNESCWGISDETFAAVEPMLAVRNGTLVCVSSPGACMGRTWEYFNNPLFCQMQLPSTVNRFLDKQWFEIQKQTMPAHVFDMEVNAQFSQAIDNYFSLELIRKCSEKYDLRSFPSGGLYFYCGIDWGRVKDSSVVVVLSKNQDGQLRIENIVEMQGTPFPNQIQQILKLNERWKFANMVSEHAGLSLGPNEELRKSIPKLKLFQPTLQNKEAAYTYLLKQMEDGRLVIPESHQKLQLELRTFRYEVSVRGQLKLHHVQGGTDDFVDALCYAVWAAKTTYRPFVVG